MDDTSLRELVRSIVITELEKSLGDIEDHKRYHEDINKSKATRQKILDSVKEKTLTALIWAALLLIGNALWDHVLSALKR